MPEELQRGWNEWRTHFWAISLTLGPVAMAGLIAWGTLTNKVEANAQQTAELSQRMRTTELSNAAVLIRLEELKSNTSQMSDKIDKLYDRAMR